MVTILIKITQWVQYSNLLDCFKWKFKYSSFGWRHFKWNRNWSFKNRTAPVGNDCQIKVFTNKTFVCHSHAYEAVGGNHVEYRQITTYLLLWYNLACYQEKLCIFTHLMLNANVISDKQIVLYVGSNFQDKKKHVSVKMVTWRYC